MDNSEESFESSLSKKNLDSDLLDEFDDADTGSLSEFHDIIDFEYYPEDIDTILDDDLVAPQNDNVLNFNLSSLEEEIEDDSLSEKPIEFNLSSFVDRTAMNILEDEVNQSSSLLEDSEDEIISLSPNELGNITNELDSDILDDDDTNLLVPDELEQNELNLDDEPISLDASELDHILNADDSDEEETEDSIFGELEDKSSLVGVNENYDDFDEGEISLSTNELDNILGSDSNEEFESSIDEDDSNEHKSFFDDFDEEEETDQQIEEDETIALSLDELGNITSTPTEEADSALEERDENIALSGDELNNLLDTGDLESEEDSSGSTFDSDEEDDESIALSPDELGNITSTETEEFVSDLNENEEEDIALSGDELNNLLDTGDLIGEEDSNPSNSIESIDDEDESIALSLDELGNITATEIEEVGSVFEDASDEDIALSGDELSNLLDTADLIVEDDNSSSTSELIEEDESIALSPDELGNITSTETEDILSPTDENNEDEIALSGEELSNLLDTSDLQIDEESSGLNEDEPISLSSEEDLELKDFSENESEVEDDIALSGDELTNLLETENQTDISQEQPTSFFETIDEEDESIALTDDELGNITPEPLSDGEEEISLSGEELNNILDDNQSDDSINDYLSNTSEDDSIDQFNYEHDESSTENKVGFDSEDTDSNISLSSNELNNILEDDPELGINEDDFIINDENSQITALDSVEDNQTLVGSENFTQTSLKNVNREELKKLMSHMDELLGSLPDSYIKEFATSEYFELYKKIMEELEL